jgi:hypothetical protein
VLQHRRQPSSDSKQWEPQIVTRDTSVPTFQFLLSRNMERRLQKKNPFNTVVRGPQATSRISVLTCISVCVSFTKQKVAVCKPYLSPYCYPLTDPFRLLSPCGILCDWSLCLPPPPPTYSQSLVIRPILSSCLSSELSPTTEVWCSDRGTYGHSPGL